MNKRTKQEYNENEFVKLMGIALTSTVTLFLPLSLNGNTSKDVTLVNNHDSVCSALHIRHPSEEYKTCYLYDGVCLFCYGRGWNYNPFGTGIIDCPNCSGGKCCTCAGS